MVAKRRPSPALLPSSFVAPWTASAFAGMKLAHGTSRPGHIILSGALHRDRLHPLPWLPPTNRLFHLFAPHPTGCMAFNSDPASVLPPSCPLHVSASRFSHWRRERLMVIIKSVPRGCCKDEMTDIGSLFPFRPSISPGIYNRGAHPCDQELRLPRRPLTSGVSRSSPLALSNLAHLAKPASSFVRWGA